MMVIGGEGELDLNDIWALNLETKEWREVPLVGDEFKARRFHTAVTYGTKVFVYGGCHDEYSFENMSDLMEIDFTLFLANKS